MRFRIAAAVSVAAAVGVSCFFVSVLYLRNDYKTTALEINDAILDNMGTAKGSQGTVPLFHDRKAGKSRIASIVCSASGTSPKPYAAWINGMFAFLAAS